MVVRAAGIAVVALAGCDARVPTSDLSAALTATVGSEMISFSLLLGEQLPQPYILASDEHLIARFHDDAVELHLFEGEYIGWITLREIVAADDVVGVRFERGTDETVELVGSAPPPVVITPPTGATSTANLLVTWSPIAHDAMRWTAMACVSFRTEGPIREDTGMLVFPPGVLAFVPGRCSVQLDLLRTRTVSQNGPLRAGVSITQIGEVSFDIAP